MGAMLEETATVTHAESDWLWVETTPKSACSHCSAAGCSTLVIGKAFGNRRNRMRLPNTLNAERGQQVAVGIPEQVLVGASLRAYLMPLMGMLLFGILAAFSEMNEVLQALFALAGLFAGLSLAGRPGMNPQTGRDYSPQLLRVVPGSGTPIEFTR